VRDGQPRGAGLLFLRDGVKLHLRAGNQFRLGTQLSQEVNQLLDTGIEGNGNGHLAVGGTKGLGLAEVNRAELNGLLPGSPADNLDQTGLRLIGRVRLDETLLASRQFGGDLLERTAGALGRSRQSCRMRTSRRSAWGIESVSAETTLESLSGQTELQDCPGSEDRKEAERTAVARSKLHLAPPESFGSGTTRNCRCGRSA